MLVLLTFVCDFFLLVFFFQAEDGIRDLVRSRGLGDVYKRQDAWFDLNVEYVHRPLKLIHDIRFKAGFMRARLPLSLIHI